MAYADEPAQKLSPRLWRAAPGYIPYSPMPTLAELGPRQAWGLAQADQPTEPLPRLDIPAENRPLKKTRGQAKRSRSRCLFVLLALVLIGGLILSSCYVLETAILGPLAQFFHPIGKDGSIDGRAWNLLVLGSDNDQKYTFPVLLTQVVMVAHVDPSKKHVTLVSLPRDSWVSVPGHAGRNKLDQAFFLGAAQRRSFDDGVRLARSTIEQDYGIPIDRYVWVGLGGFASVIDTLGGVDIDLTHPLVDDAYPDDTGSGANPHDPYAFTRLYLAPGPQHLNGEHALEYVRSRHSDLIGDIGRTARQQQVLVALRNKLNTSNVVEHLPQILHNLAGKVYTDLSRSELLSMAGFARNLSPRAISHITLGPGPGRQNYGSPTQGESQDIIIPNCANIQPVINDIFGMGDAQSCHVGGPGG